MLGMNWLRKHMNIGSVPFRAHALRPRLGVNRVNVHIALESQVHVPTHAGLPVR